MSNIETGGPAFPYESMYPGSKGITLRDYFAAKALTGYFAAPYTPHMGAANIDVAKYCYEMADAMLKAREAT